MQRLCKCAGEGILTVGGTHAQPANHWLRMSVVLTVLGWASGMIECFGGGLLILTRSHGCWELLGN